MPIKLRASDTVAWYKCHRRFWFDHHPPPGPKPEPEPFDELIKRLGDQHETAVRDTLDPAMPMAGSVEATRDLIDQGAPFIYQPVFLDETLMLEGRPDFLILNGNGRYQIADAKLARSLKSHKDIKVQLGLYRRLLRSDDQALVYLGTGATDAVGAEVDPEVDRFLTEARETVESDEIPVVSYAESRCSACPYYDVCRPKFEEVGDLSLVYGIDARSLPGLNKQGIVNLAQLAERDPETIEDAPWLKGAEKKQRIVAQARAKQTGEITILKPIELPDGTYVHFDVESNPLTDTGEPEVYLWGLLPPPYDNDSFLYAWSDGDADQDRAAWERLLDLVDQLVRRHPDLRLVHYTAYEITQLKMYADRYEMRDDPRVARLLGPQSILMDIQKPILESLILPVESYGLKPICKHPDLVNFQWELEESGAQWSVVRYMDYLAEADPPIRERIKSEVLTYNRDDVAATRAIQLWLERFE